MTRTGRSLQKVQGHRTAQGHRARVDAEVTPPTGGPVGHPPNPATLCDRSAQGSKSWHSGSFAKILRHRPCHNFLPGVLCVAQGHRITSYGSWHAHKKNKTGLPTGMSHRTACGWSQVRIDSGPVALYLLQWPVRGVWLQIYKLGARILTGIGYIHVHNHRTYRLVRKLLYSW